MIQDFELRFAGGEYRLLDLRDSAFPYREPLRLNETGAAIYRRLNGEYSMEALCVFMNEEYGLSMEEAREDLQAFLDSLVEYGVPIALE